MIKLDFYKIIGYFINRNDKFIVIKLARDWKVLLLSFSVIFIIVILSSGYFFWTFQSESLIKKQIDTEEDSSSVLKEKLIDSLLEELDKKNENYKNVLDNPPKIQDPSL